MRNMLRFLKGYEKESILAPLFKMLEACFELLVPLVVANIIDVGIKNGDLAYIGKQCGLMVLLAVVGMASSLTAQYFAAKAALGYGTALRGALFRHIDTLSYTELDGIGTPTLVTRITSDVNQLQNGVNMTLRLLLRCPFIVIGALILAFVISPTMGFWFVLVTLAISLVVWLIMRVTVPQYRAAQNTLDKVTLLTRENYVGARVVRAFARQDDEIADFTAVNDKLKTFQLTAGRISALMTPLTYLIVNLGVIAILMRGGLQVNSGALTQGEIIALINYMNQILINLLRIADLVVSVTRALARGIRASEILNTKSTMTDPAAAALAPAAGAPAVAFDHVGFTYHGAGAPSLTDISFAAQNGQTIGVGAGQQSRIHCTRLAGDKADFWHLRRHPKVLGLSFDPSLKRAERDNEIDRFIREELSAEEKREWLAKVTDVALGSDAFFPFGDNIERAAQSGVKYVAEPGGSIRDDNVIETADKYGMVMCFTGIRLFHH